MEAHGCFGKLTMDDAMAVSLENEKVASGIMEYMVEPIKGDDLSDMWRSKEIGVGGYLAEISRIINQAGISERWKPVGDPEDITFRLF